MLEEILAYNREFIKKKEYESFISDKYPEKKIAIVSCMDTRLTELLPAALGIKNGDAKIIKKRRGRHIPSLRQRYEKSFDRHL